MELNSERLMLASHDVAALVDDMVRAGTISEGDELSDSAFRLLNIACDLIELVDGYCSVSKPEDFRYKCHKVLNKRLRHGKRKITRVDYPF